MSVASRLDPSASLGARVMAIVEALAAHSDGPGLTRLYLSDAHRRTAEAARNIMSASGLEAWIDPLGTVVGRLGAAELPALLVGSHLDSVVDAGRFDGPLGVATGIAVAEALAREGAGLPFAIEILGFGDEENVRFPTNLSTSAALAGRYDPAWLDGRDAKGVALRDALLGFGGDPDAIPGLARDPARTVGYLEIHIEQGPVLEAEGLPVGIVSSIAAVTRARCRVGGEAGHAGTVPMALRRDALAAAAEMVALIEATAAARPGAVATVGQMQVAPGAVNVIPAEVRFTLDARAPGDALRDAVVEVILDECRAVAARRGVAFAAEVFMDSPATPMHPDLAAGLESAVAAQGVRPFRLPSGAGHDAVAMAHLCPCAMLFVRCRGGVSHNPAEAITEADADIAARVLLAAVRELARG